MDMQQLGYYLYMDKCEKEQQRKQEEDNEDDQQNSIFGAELNHHKPKSDNNL